MSTTFPPSSAARPGARPSKSASGSAASRNPSASGSAASRNPSASGSAASRSPSASQSALPSAPRRLGLAVAGGLLLLACTSTGGPGEASRAAGALPELPAALRHEPLDLATVEVSEGEQTVEDSFVLDLYTFFHSKDFRALQARFPDGEGEPVTVHLLVPPGPGPHPAVVVFPILGGSHVVSEALAKAFVDRGFAAARLERRALDLDEIEDPDIIFQRFAGAVRDGRRLVDWLQTRPEIDGERIGAAGVSLGSLLACLLQAVDPRVRAGFLALTGGGLAEILYSSRERDVRVFRERLVAAHGLDDRESFLAFLAPHVWPVEPLRYARALRPEDVLLVTGRFDRIIRPDRAEALWEELGQPRWIRVPTGHYQALPFLWYAADRGARHLRNALGVETDAVTASER